MSDSDFEIAPKKNERGSTKQMNQAIMSMDQDDVLIADTIGDKERLVVNRQNIVGGA